MDEDERYVLLVQKDVSQLAPLHLSAECIGVHPWFSLPRQLYSYDCIAEWKSKFVGAVIGVRTLSHKVSEARATGRGKLVLY